MSLRKARSTVILIVASMFSFSSVASASLIQVLVETNDYDAISVDGYFELDTTNPEEWVVSDWSLNVTLNEDPVLDTTNSMAFFTASATSSSVSFVAASAGGICGSNNECLTQLDIAFDPIGSAGQATVLSVSSVCATTMQLAFAPTTSTTCNRSTASIILTASTVVVPVPEPTAIVLFGIGMLAIYPIQRRLHR